MHYILSFTREDYGRATSLSAIKDKWSLGGSKPATRVPPKGEFLDEDVRPPPAHKANATFVILARNGDLPGVIDSIRQLEDRFNRHYHYPYVFLNEEPFNEEFKRYVGIQRGHAKPLHMGVLTRVVQMDWQPDLGNSSIRFDTKE